MEKVATIELILELEKRGFYTGLLFGRAFVEGVLDDINTERDEDGEEPIVINQYDMSSILSRAINVDSIRRRIEENIEENILEYYQD